MKKTLSYFVLALMMVLMTGVLTAAAPAPNVTFELVQGLPTTMHVGETYTVIVKVTSDTPYNMAAALPNFQYPGRGVVAARGSGGGDHVTSGTEALLEVSFTAKNDTSSMPNGETYDTVSVVAGAHFKGGYVATEAFTFQVTVPAE